MDNKSRNLELEAWLIETTGEEMMANHLGPNWNRFDDEFGFYPNMGMTVADLVWQHQQAKVEELDSQLLAYKKFALNMGKKIGSEALRISAKKFNMTTAAEKKLIQDLWDAFNNEADKALSVEQALKGEG